MEEDVLLFHDFIGYVYEERTPSCALVTHKKSYDA